MIRLASTLCAFTSLCALLAASPVTPDRGGAKPAAAAPVRADAKSAAPATGTQSKAEAAGGLTPRTPHPKRRSSDITLPTNPKNGKPTWNGRLVVKFHDHVKGRAEVVPAPFAKDARGTPITAFNEVLSNFRGTVRSLTKRTPQELRGIEVRAERKSGKATDDLAGMVYVDVRPDDLLAAARAFNDLAIVEWVSIESTPEQHQDVGLSPQYGCGTAQAQWIPPQDVGPPQDFWGAGVSNCYTAATQQGAARCSILGGGPGCNASNQCTLDPVGPGCRFGCNDTACCTIVSTCITACADEGPGKGWDAVCATYANVLCASFGSLYSPGTPVTGFPENQVVPEVVATDVNTGSLPVQYRYDPCFAMRGPISLADPRVRVQGSVVNVAAPVGPGGYPVEGFGLVTYDVDPATGEVDLTSFEALAYPSSSTVDEGDPRTNIPQRALPDPSLEGAGGLLMSGCFSEHELPGCNQAACCVYVCRKDPSCCQQDWDDNCVSLAVTSPAGDAPDELPPCFNDQLTSPDFFIGRSPLFSGGRTPDGEARGYQVYTIAAPVSRPFQAIVDTNVENCPGEPPVNYTYPIPAPTVNDPSNRCDLSSNGGTRAFLNSGYRGGGLDMQSYAFAMYQFGVEEGPIPDPLQDPTFDPYDPSQAPLNGFGQGVRVAVIDNSAYIYNLPNGTVGGHEDLVNVVTPEPNQTPILVNLTPIDPNHGTAVLGVIGAEQNNFGITGIASGLDDLRFYPSVSFEEGERLASALTNALIDLDEGDVICLPIGFAGNTVLTDPAVYTLVNNGILAGITVVVSAGNGGFEAAVGPPDFPASSAVIVGAAWAGYRVGVEPNYVSTPAGLNGLNYCRYKASNFGAAVTVSGWGGGVTTLGYGDLFTGPNPASDPVPNQANPPFPPGGGLLTQNRLRTYTTGESFEGTSAACAMITAWIACLQSFAQQFYGAPIAVQDLGEALTIEDNGFQQCGYPYEDFLGAPLPIYPGRSAACPTLGDILSVAEGGVQSQIGRFPRTPETVSWIAAEAFSGANPVDFEVITGIYEGGSAFSIRERDAASLLVQSVRRRAGNVGQGVGNPLYYSLNGGTTDVQLIASTSSPIGAVTGFRLDALSRTSWSLPTARICYFYNFALSRWQAMGYQLVTNAFPVDPDGGGGPETGGDKFYSSNAGPLDDFLIGTSSGGAQAWARVYTCGFGNVSYTVFHDVLDFTLCIEGGNEQPCTPPNPNAGGGGGGGFGGGGGGF
jgi:hypothetical protein